MCTQVGLNSQLRTVSEKIITQIANKPSFLDSLAHFFWSNQAERIFLAMETSLSEISELPISQVDLN